MLFQNVVVLLTASETTSPSLALNSNLSTSSNNKTLIGLEAKELVLLEPTKLICPPVKTLCNTVFPLSRSLGGLTLSVKTGQSLIIELNLSLLKDCAIDRVG